MEMSINFPNLGIYLNNVGSSFNLYGYEITYYGILIACSMLLATAYVLVWAKRTSQNPNTYLELVIVSGIGAILGGRLVYALFYLELFQEDIQLLWKLRDGGFSLYGAILGGMLFVWLLSLTKKASFGLLADTVSMGLLFVQIAGRVGNFFNRECFGDYTNSLFAMQLPASVVRSSEITPLMQENLVTIDTVSYIQVHPAFLYESLWCLLLLFFLMWYRRRRRFEGELFLVYLLGYSIGRIWIEELRTDPLQIPGMNRSFSQIAAAFLALFCLLLVLGGRMMDKKRKEAKKRMQEAKYQAEEKAVENFDESMLTQGEEQEPLDVDALLAEIAGDTEKTQEN